MKGQKVKTTWENKLKNEFVEYWFNVVYLAIFFSVFIFYRRLILAHYEVYLEDYFMGVVKALVFAKVIMIGAFLRLDKGFEEKPLFIPVLYKSILFTIWLALFDVAEAFIKAIIVKQNFNGALEEISNHFTNIWIGGAVVVFITFIPFFAFKELSRIMGPEKIQNLFFKKRKIKN